MLHLASQLKAGKGLSIVVSFLRGNPVSVDDRKNAEQVRRSDIIYVTIVCFYDR
jgi:hypothetical protein